ncbi:BnaC03g41870D [Brassica napus]|uniref:BnaC03g41870D protein n=2 Tax=Brassica TaxID=3705 RepID=A0A078FE93_BRANA|nr:BnaC06g31780D [Brassica napus]CDY32403.1 BnaC03g41870D [Brassica napus]
MEDGEMSWFNAGVRVDVGIGLGVCVGFGHWSWPSGAYISINIQKLKKKAHLVCFTQIASSFC